jgi:hypothetical protein
METPRRPQLAPPGTAAIPGPGTAWARDVGPDVAVRWHVVVVEGFDQQVHARGIQPVVGSLDVVRVKAAW